MFSARKLASSYNFAEARWWRRRRRTYRPRHLGGSGRRWLHLRILVAMALAVLTIPLAGPASAEEADPATAEVTSTATDDAPAAEEPPAETPPAEEPAAEEAPAEEPPAETPAEEPPAEEPAQQQDPQPQPAPEQQPATKQAAPSLQSSEPLVAAQAAPTGVPGVCDTNTGVGSISSFTQNTKEDGTGQWIGSVLNANKSDYAEGDFVPQRIVFAGLTPGEHELVFSYDVTKNGVYAYDYVAHERVVGGDISRWFVENEGGPTATVRVTFFVPETTTGSATLYFDMHIASEIDWGPGMGAGTIDGAPYHVKLESLNCKSIGSMDNQLMASAVDAGTVTVTKTAEPADGTDFSFTLAGEDSVDFSLDVDGDPTLSDTVTYRVAPGTWSVSENAIPEGWSLTDLVCTGTSATYQDATASFPVVDDQAVTCTFTDTKKTYDDLTVTKTATPSYARDYDWTISKQVVGEDSQDVPEGSQAEFDYEVVVTPSAPKDTGFEVTGEITVTNPNDVAMEGVSITDTTPGATCEITGVTGPVTLQPGRTTYDYTCTFTDATAQTAGTNTVDLTWSSAAYYGSSGSASGTAGYDFGTVTPATTDDTVTVTDSEVDLSDPEVVPEGNVVRAIDGETTFPYSLTWPGEPGTCTDYDNTATLTETDGDSQQASESVEVCVGSDLEVSKTVVEQLTRTYDWDVTKTADDATLEVDPDTGKVTATYDVTISAGEYADSDWLMSGSITVTNPNDWQDVTLDDITDVYDGGGTCVVDDSDGLVIAAGGSRTFDYTCTFEDKPESYSGTNTATVTWDATAAATPSGSASGTATVADKDWSKALVNEEVTLVDDLATPADESDDVVLGTYAWSEGFTTTVEHSLELGGEAGSCVDHTNTASVVGEGDTVLDSDDADVEVCWPVDLTVSKTATASYDRTYLWDVTKAADDPTTVEVAGDGSATFGFTVEAVPNGYADDGHTLAGTITVTNPNDFRDVTVDITDSVDIDGVSCEVSGGTGVVVSASGSVSVDYTCDVTGLAESDYSGHTNTATATWDGGSASGTRAVAFVLDDETDKTVDVVDDKTAPFNPPVHLGTATWNEAGTPKPFTYSLTQYGVAGQCTDYTNTASVRGDAGTTLDTAQATVTVCKEASLSVSKTVEATFERTYQWDIDKVADDPTTVEVADGGEATFDYTVTATPRGFVDSDWVMQGTITVANPNGYDAGSITADVTDLTDVGAECTVAGGKDLVVAPGESVDLSYTCTVDEQPDYQGLNTATATWLDAAGEEQSAHGSADVLFDLAGETNRTVDVYDDKTDPDAEPVLLGQATWNKAGTATPFTYSLTQEGVAGACTAYPNTAWIEQTGQSATAEATVCVEAGLQVDKEVTAGFDRTYLWQIDKSVDDDRAEVVKGDPVFDYTVAVTPDGYVDSGWEMAGTITVTNPNSYDAGAVTAEVTDLTDVGGGADCTVDGGSEVSVAPGATVELDYACTFESQPAYDGLNTATATWTSPGGGEREVSAEADVAFGLDEETHKTVDVYDDKTQPGAEPVHLGQATWNADGTPTELTYDLALEEQRGEPGRCTEYPNTAWIEQTGQDDSVTVVVCRYGGDGGLVVTKTAEASFDRTYAWDIDKRVDRTGITAGEDGKATASYTVEVTPRGLTDSGWQMTGAVTVHNPNDWADLTIGLEDLPDVGEGVTCTFDDPEAVVERGGTTTYPYTCTFDGQPEYDGTNVVDVQWRNDQGQGQGDRNGSSTASTPVTFEVGQETGKVVTVVDDMVGAGTLGEVTWPENGQDSTLFEYSVDLTAAPGACETVVNTATIVETGQDAQATVDLCGPDEILPVEQVVSRPPVDPAVTPPVAPAEIAGVQGGLPATGAPAGTGLVTLIAGLSVLLGSWLLLRTRRTAAGRSPRQ